jgi:hypothetical protein
MSWAPSRRGLTSWLAGLRGGCSVRWSECGKGGRYGAQWADRRWWETGGLDVVA